MGSRRRTRPRSSEPRLRSAARFASGALVAAALALGAGAQEARAQTAPLEVGREARLYVRGVADVFEGTITAVRDDAVAITLLDGASFTFQTAQLERAEVRANRPNTLLGGIVGGGLGLAVGVILLVTDDSAGRELGESFDPWKVIAPPIGGAALGAALGGFIRTPRWAPAFVPLAGAAPGDFALSWTLPFGGGTADHVD